MKYRNLTLVAVALFAVSPLRAADNKVMLAHTYTAGDKDTYKLDGEIKGDNKQKISAEFVMTYGKANDEGGCSFEMKLLKMVGPGIEAGKELPTLNGEFNKLGIPKDFDVKDQSAVLAFFAIGNYLPKDSVVLRKSFPVDVKTEDGLVIKGDGTLESIQDSQGTYKVKYNLVVVPNGDHEGKVMSISTFETRTGKLLATDTTVTLENGGMHLKIVRMPK